MVDKLSYKLMKQIQNRPKKLPLTDIAEYFNPSQTVGCAGTVNVDGLRKKVKAMPSCACPSNRDHFEEKASKTKITYKKPIYRYDLKQGH